MAPNTLWCNFMVNKKREHYAKLKEAFAVFDKESTGFIKCEDVGKFVRSIGDNLTDDEVKHVIDVLDVNNNGVVGFTRFLSFLATTLEDADPEEDLKAIFELWDKDGDGFISAADLRAGSALTEEQANSMVKTADLDGDGKVGYEDMKKIWIEFSHYSQISKYLVKKREEHYPKLKEAFALFDKENTGFIKCEDLGKVLRSTGEKHTDEELKDAIYALDVYKIGVVEFSDFMKFMVPCSGDDASRPSAMTKSQNRISAMVRNRLWCNFMVNKKREKYVKLKEAFAVFDKESTGFIKCEDVGKVLRSIGDNPTDGELKHVIDVLDVDKNGVVGFTKFLSFLATTLEDDDPEEDLKATFELWDKDGDGVISAAELRAESALTEEVANSMFKVADFDGDGKVGYEDMKKLWIMVSQLSEIKISAVANSVLAKNLVERREEHYPKLKKAFALFDKENTGFIKCEDLGKVMKSLGEKHTDEELKDAIYALDVHEIGVIEFSDLLKFMLPLLGDDDPEEFLKRAFKIFDKDGDGFITAEEICDVTASRPRAMTHEEAKFAVKRADFDGDGKMDYEEFKKMMLRKCDSST